MADGLNDYRTNRVAQVMTNFRSLQYYISAAPCEPPSHDDITTEGWILMRQCAIDGRHILDVGTNTSVPTTQGGPDEQAKAELQQILLDAFARRHESQKIWLRQGAGQRWIGWREAVLQGQRPSARQHGAQLAACDAALRAELATISDEAVYEELNISDCLSGCWTAEDPSLRQVRRWLRARR